MRFRSYTLASLLLLSMLGSSLLAQPAESRAGKKLSLEEIFSESGLLGPLPTQLRWSSDGLLLTYILADQDGEWGDLWSVDASTGEKRILVGQELLSRLAPSPHQATSDERERERLIRYRVPAYRWAPDSKAILFISSGQLHLFDLGSGESRLLAPAKHGALDPKFSPDGKWISFVHEHDLWLVPVAGGQEKQLTTGGSADVLHGDLDWVYPEELGVRTGYKWSPDSKRIAFLEIDQHRVPNYPIADLAPRAARLELQRYPQAGDPNPKVRVGIVPISAPAEQAGSLPPRMVWIDRAAEYIPRFAWIDKERLGVELLDRAQTELELIFVEAFTGRSHSVLVESDPHWINITDDLKFLSEREEFLWTSERTGFRHIYLYGFDSALKRTLTSGDWEVTRIVDVDQKEAWVYFTSNQRNPLGRDLYRVKLEGGPAELLTQAPGTHKVSLNSSATAFADTYSALDTVPQLNLQHLPSGRTTGVHPARSVEEYELVKPELVELKAPDGALVRGMLLKPHALEPGRRYPVLVHVYGGPHAPTIRDEWLGNRYLFHQYLASQGFVVFYLDDRASSLLGHRYEIALYRNYGPTVLEDLRRGVEYLRSLDFVDPDRMALWGWSGGGFSTSFALTHSALFKVGMAVAPVTDWHLYDSIYTERYMGLPQAESEAYRHTSVVRAAADLQGRLLLVHGDADDNVHIQNTVQLINALIQAGKAYDLQVFPRKTHSLRGAQTQLHLYRELADYLKLHLEPRQD